MSEINARGLWHAIHFNLRSVSFMSRDNTDVLVPLVCLLLLVAGVRSCMIYILDLSLINKTYIDTLLKCKTTSTCLMFAIIFQI